MRVGCFVAWGLRIADCGRYSEGNKSESWIITQCHRGQEPQKQTPVKNKKEKINSLRIRNTISYSVSVSPAYASVLFPSKRMFDLQGDEMPLRLQLTNICILFSPENVTTLLIRLHYMGKMRYSLPFALYSKLLLANGDKIAVCNTRMHIAEYCSLKHICACHGNQLGFLQAATIAEIKTELKASWLIRLVMRVRLMTMLRYSCKISFAEDQRLCAYCTLADCWDQD